MGMLRDINRPLDCTSAIAITHCQENMGRVGRHVAGSQAKRREPRSQCCRASPADSPSPSGNPGEEEKAVPHISHPQSNRNDHNASWAHLLMAYPLELATAGARTNALWLKRRKRSRWWSRQEFPRVMSRFDEEFACFQMPCLEKFMLARETAIWHSSLFRALPEEDHAQREVLRIPALPSILVIKQTRIKTQVIMR